MSKSRREHSRLVPCSPARLLFGQDRSKKAYELIYEDIQVLKKQLSYLEEKIDQERGRGRSS